MQFRSTGTRVATAVTTVLAVTALGAGTLATAPAAFAAVPAAASASVSVDQPAALPVFPEGASLAGTGSTGFLTYSFAQDGTRNLLWTPYDGGTPTQLQEPEDGGFTMAGSDVVVLGDNNWNSQMRSLTLRNMADPSAPGVDIDLGALNGNYVAVLSPTSVLAQVTKDTRRAAATSPRSPPATARGPRGPGRRSARSSSSAPSASAASPPTRTGSPRPRPPPWASVT